ncbi:epsin-3 isoform X2 [Elephas maximus indicus]|uniref:epsin-3 isoform X2 n=1 Tax=Elephas maximus indicus TaxID=99487 RepID=UPI0021166038|nr:epsin-3 isoform X2 [Elephas maximus indicus]
MTTSALRRQVKNIVHNYSEAEIKVREATSNDPWGPPSSLMSEIADLTFNTVALSEVMGMLWRRLNDSGKNWRHVYKALTLLDYLLKTGSERVAHQCRENLYTIQTLKDFQYIDRDGKDQGVNVREKVKQVMALLKDEERLRQERTQALKTKERLALEGMSVGSGQLSFSRRHGDDYGHSRGSPSSYNSSSSSPRYTSDLEQARPQTSGEEELQLQLALAMSREEAEKPVPPASHRDEDLQLQLALRLSQQEHEKEVRSWRGDDSLMANGAGAAVCHREDREPQREDRKEEEQLKTSQSSILDLADIFVPAPGPPSTHCSADPWDIPGLRPNTEPSGSSWGPSADPWSPVPSGNALSRSQPWDLLPTLSSSEPWGRTPVLPARPPTTDSWALNFPHHKLPTTGADPWGDPMETSNTPALGGTSTLNLFAKPPESTETKERLEGAQALPSGKPSSPVELDLFGDPVPSSKQNGLKEPDAFDLDVLGEALTQPSKEVRACRTPESFLGPSASSLVNLDSLVKAPQAAKTQNPFLTGLSAPPPTNPFGGGERGWPTLKQVRTGSPVLGLAVGGPVEAPLGSMTYSASLPLPLSSVPAGVTLPASVSVFPQAGAFSPPPASLPPPLLPTSASSGPLNPPPQAGTNPFL